MKKALYFAALLLLPAFVACEKEDIENTATVSMAGDWYCTVDAVDDNGNPITQMLDGRPNDGEDYFGVGLTHIMTYNTADNTTAEMWIDNQGIGNYAADYADNWESYGFMPTYAIKAKVNINLTALTFSSTDAPNFGEGYDWVEKVPGYDDQGKVRLDEDGDTILVDHIFHSEAGMPVTIEGKILPMAGTQPNGSKADSIVFFVTYKDDPWYPDDGYTKYKVSGIRYSGLVEND